MLSENQALTVGGATGDFSPMSYTLLDGKKVAEAVYSTLVLDLSLLPVVPKLVVVLVGEDAASQTYVRSKTKKCSDLGIRGETLNLPATVTENELLATIKRLNEDKDVHGILVQLPLPKGIDKNRVIWSIDPRKDVDGLHPENSGRLFAGNPRLVPCTPLGIVELLKHYQLPIEGKRAVVIGRSEIVGKPAALLMLQNQATVVMCHSKTQDLAGECRGADILIAALGQPRFIGPEMVKEGAVVVDVGIHRLEGGLAGDVDFARVAPKTSAITPVPGGVGPLTIAMLMKNLVTAAKLQA